ncbi:hypothetical protein T492DRAFT_1141920 [Pavlovales sp. CCMP2436]|nr:hypothetical protein T492DRAFT_1141920 [Pavlovales sp. CCMP2436]
MRWRPTSAQKYALERIFAKCRSPLPETLELVATSLGLTTKQVRIYFQNRRLRRKETAPPIATNQFYSPPTSFLVPQLAPQFTPQQFAPQQFAPQFAPISTPPRVLSAAVLGFIHPLPGHPLFTPVSLTASYTCGPPTKKAMIVKQSSSSFPVYNPRSRFTLTEAQQGVASALQLQHAQQHIGAVDERSALFPRPSAAGIPMLAHKSTFGLTFTNATAGDASWAWTSLAPLSFATPPPIHIAPRPTAKGALDEQLLLQLANVIDVECMIDLLDHVDASSS